jgi:hypothetical protein
MVIAASREVRVNGGAQMDHLFQARLPLQVYDWLRSQWYEQRLPMNSVVTATVAALRTGHVHLDPRLIALATDEGEAVQRFTVRLRAPDYEWLRAEAFRRRVSINRLLVAALEARCAPPTPGTKEPGGESTQESSVEAYSTERR